MVERIPRGGGRYRQFVNRRFAGRGNDTTEHRDIRDIEIERLQQRIRELEIQLDSTVKEMEYELSVSDDGEEEVNPFDGFYQGFHEKFQAEETESKPIVWDEGEEEEEYPLADHHEVNYSCFFFHDKGTKEEIPTFMEENIKPLYDTYGDDEPFSAIEIDNHGKVHVIQYVSKRADIEGFTNCRFMIGNKEN